MKIVHPNQLASLRKAVLIQSIEIDADAFLAGNLPLYLFKYAVWALGEGGIARVQASRCVDSMGIVPGVWSFQFLVQAACMAIDGLGTLTEVDLAGREFTFIRTSKPLPPAPWSAVVMFSGKREELPLIHQCLAGLKRQRCLVDGGQIAVCGPEASSALLSDQCMVEYLPFETPSIAGRFLVGKKKNFAIRSMRHERVLVCHSRIILGEGCLDQMPREFDLITPRVEIQTSTGRRLPYLDLFFQVFSSVLTYSDRPAPFLGYPRSSWRRYLRTHYPYADGGVFGLQKSLLETVPISEVIAWGEGEDVEWSRRLMAHGHIIELMETAVAESVVNKLDGYARFGHLPALRYMTKTASHIKALARRCLGI